MHGRKKSDLPQTKEEKDAVKAKISNYEKVIGAVIHKRNSDQVDSELKGLVGKVLRLQPDYYSMWNYRRETILEEVRSQCYASLGVSLKLKMLGDGEGLSNPEAVGAVYKEELRLTVDCFKRSPKSYPAWHHRKWALGRWMVLPEGREMLNGELDLCKQFLELDGRNFHCWAYRMWVARETGLRATSEFEFTTEKIMQNFSNYSAFHYRSKLLLRMVLEEGRDRWELLDEELDITHQAMFTEPADQSVWWYHHFLLSWARKDGKDGMESFSMGNTGASEDVDHYHSVLRSEVSVLQELIEVEGRCKV
ncbi:unnamed protein product [Discosporangium mesarthrocarpum]